MNSILTWLESTVASLPLPLLEVWGRLAFLIGLVLTLMAFGGFTFRLGEGFGLGRERWSWDAKAFLAIPVTFLAILVTGYLGSFIVLVPGAQTLESLKDLMVFLCVTLFGYPALLTVPFAYGLSDLIEGVPPAFLLDWLPGYFINPTCFWLAYQLIGKDPDLRKAAVWGRYLVFVALFLFLEPMMWGYICSDVFTSDISYRNITAALFFTTSLTWLLAPPALLLAFPLARRYGLFWADLPGHVEERRLGSKTPAWVSGRGMHLSGEDPARSGWPIRMVILAPLLSMMLLLAGATAFVTLRSAKENALHLTHRLNESITCNVGIQLDEQARGKAGRSKEELFSRILKDLPISKHGVALVLEGNRILASSGPPDDPVALLAASELAKVMGSRGTQDPVRFEFHRITERPLGRATWLARAESFPGWKDRTILIALPEAYYLSGVRTANSRSAMIFTLALLLTLALTAALAGGVTGGLTRLSEVSRSLARGDLSRRVPGSRLTELNDLSLSFNNMADRLSQTIDQLREEVGKRLQGEKALETSESLLRKTEDRAKLAVRAAKMGVWDWDVEHNQLIWDDSMYELYGIDKKDFSGAYEAWAASLDPNDRERAAAEVQAALKGAKTFDTEFRVRRSDGIRTLRVMAQVFRSASGRPLRMIGVNWDITERKARQTLLAEETRILEMIASRVPLPQVLEAIVRAIESISPGTIGSILLMDPDGVHVRHGAAPNLPEAYNQAIEGRPIGEKAGSCGTAAFRGETVIVTDIAKDPLWEKYREAALPHGLKACWSTPIKDSKGKVLGTFAMYYREPRVPQKEDLDLIQRATHLAWVAIERARAEDDRKKLEGQFHQAQKMEAVGHLAGGIAHDFNNMLTAILGFAKFLKGDLPEGDARRRDAEQIISTAERATTLTRQLLSFSRKQVLQPVLLDLNRWVDDTRKMLRPLLGEDIQLELRLDGAPVRCMADPGQVQQVLLNLAVNARDAMPDGGRLMVETRTLEVGPEVLARNPEARSGRYAQVSVSDTGTGMGPEVLSRIFEPFFTTKEMGKGTGLGLPMVYGIVRQSGGFIEVESKVGAGTAFRLYFPSAEGPETALPQTAPEGETRGGSESILVVEDEATLRELAERALTGLGYKVALANDGLEALRYLAEGKKVDLMITDVVMPRVSGPALVETAHKDHPDMAILFVSGHADDITARYGLPLKEAEFLPKPYSLGDLARRVRRILDSRKDRA